MTAVKTVGRSGQISLGKQYAGRKILMDEVEPGVWMIKLGEFIPDNERWLWAGGTQAEIDRAVAWAEAHPARETDLDALSDKLDGHG